MKDSRSPRSRASLYSIYVLLAVVNLATIGLTVALAQRTARDYRNAVVQNHRSAERSARFADLRTSVTQVNTAVIDVFVTLDPALQQRRLDDAMAAFALAVSRCEQEIRAATPEDARKLERDLGYIRVATGDLVASGETILALAGDDRIAATTRVPAMQTSFVRVLNRIRAVADSSRSEQMAAFARQSEDHEALTRYGMFVTLLIAVFVIGTAAYGARMARELESGRERERYIEELERRKNDLKAVIAERDAQQKILVEREGLLLEAEQLAAVGSWEWNTVTDEVRWSDELCRIFGVEPNGMRVTFGTYIDRVHRADVEPVKAQVTAALESGGRFAFDHRIVRPGGEVRLVRAKGRVDVDANGLPVRMVGVALDVTEKEVALAKLRRKEIQLEQAQKIARVASWDFNPATGESTWSDELFRIAGISPDSIVPSFEAYVALVHPEDRGHFVRMVDEWKTQKRAHVSVRHRLVRSDGEIVHVVYQAAAQSRPNGGPPDLIGVVQDVTAAVRAEESLRLSQERFAMAALATTEVIWDYDARTRSVWYSDAYEKLFGYPLNEDAVYSAAHWQENIHPDDVAQVKRSFHRTVAAGDEVWSAEYRRRTAAGEWRDVFDRGYLVRDADGMVLRMIGATMDITDRKRAARDLARVHRQRNLVLNSAAEGIFGLDRDGTINLANAAGARMLGWEVADLLGRQSHFIVHPVAADGVSCSRGECAIRATLSDRGQVRRSDIFRRKDGSALPVEWTTNPMLDDDGRVIGSVITFCDITERRAIERMKDEFVSTVSHELRTPLTSIRGALGLLATGRLGEFPEKAKRLLDIAVGNTDRLVKLINDILDIERMDSGKITISAHPTAVDRMIAEAVDGLRPLLERASLEVIVSAVPEIISLDSHRILQTITNLLSNAIKFSPAGSTIRVSAERDHSGITFRVSDEGRGIPADKLDLIFERFQQVDASDSRDKGGSGLGLAICRSIVAQHGGEIRVESELGRGSTFTFNIPAPPPRTAAAPERAPRRKVFVCDDDEDTRALMRHFLTTNDFDVTEYSRAEDLLRVLETPAQLPDVILLDVFMPGMNGFEALARLNGSPETARIPVVIVSTLDPEAVGGSVSGMCAWLPKPLSEESFIAALNSAVGLRARPRVLIVEDDVDLARVLVASFESYGADAVHAVSGREALALAQQSTPDLLVLDLVLPDIDGFAVVDWLKSHDLCSSVPLLVYSALETSAAQQERLRLGRTEFLTKSRVSPEDFERRVGALLHSITTIRTGEISNAA